jgi:tRNA A-37 threonylcarbamoyl transferase component Bud32
MFLASRAKREFDNLQAARKFGLPVVPPIGWAEIRKKGMLHFSAVGTLYVPALCMRDTIAVFQVEDPRRIEIIRSSGQLLARLHEAGLSWMTALSRNIMVVDRSGGELLAIDVPYGHWAGRSIISRHEAIYDVNMMLTDGLCHNKFSPLEAHKFLDAYCNGDRSTQYKLQERLNSSSERSRWIYRIFTKSAAILKPVTSNCTRKINNHRIRRKSVTTEKY